MMPLANSDELLMANTVLSAIPGSRRIKKQSHDRSFVYGFFHGHGIFYLYNLCPGSGNGLVKNVTMLLLHNYLRPWSGEMGNLFAFVFVHSRYGCCSPQNKGTCGPGSDHSCFAVQHFSN